MLRVITAAADAKIDLVQIREKNLTGRSLYELACAAVRTVRGSTTSVLVNDRADIAVASGAHGVHLTTRSLSPDVIRKSFGPQFLIGASTHSIAEVSRARAAGADFAVFGPVFETPSKPDYYAPVGVERLQDAVNAVAPFPILPLGGVNLDNAAECYRAGASGIAAISVLSNPETLAAVVKNLRENFDE